VAVPNLNFKNSASVGPAESGAASSGYGPVTFGGGAPNTAAALVTGLTSSPWLLAGLVAGAVAIVWILYRK
jgi:hypothetical protein